MKYNIKFHLEKRFCFVLIILAFALALVPLAEAAASFAVNSFSCTPSEVPITSDFSCTAQIINNGDAAGSVSVATLYSDSNDWLEESNYAQASGTSVDPGQTTEATFSGLRSTKSGASNGFSKITLDSVTDTDGVDGISVNVIDVAVTLSNSASSKAASQTFDSSAEVTAGGNIDATLTFTVDSGGCSIGNQASSKSISGMTNNDRQSRSWTVTMGTSGDCIYTITASATGTAGVATKSDSSSSTITCSSGCSSGSSGTSAGGSSGAGGGGGVGKLAKSIGEISLSVEQEINKGEYVSFTFGGENHSISVTNLTEVTAEVIIRSSEKKFIMTVQEEKKVDLDDDGKNDISLKLKSVNIIKKSALFVITPLYVPEIKKGKDSGSDNEGSEKDEGSEEGDVENGKSGSLFLKILLVLVVAAVISLVAFFVIRAHKTKKRYYGFE